MAELLKILRAYIVLGVLAVVGLIAWKVVTTFAWMRVPEDNNNMAPVLQIGQVFRLDKTAARPDGGLKRGDIVAYLKDPADPGAFLLGRIVALPGERVAIQKGDVLLNGEKLIEPAISVPTEGGVEEILVPRGHYYLLVDLRNDPLFRASPGEADSRGFGPVSAARLLGRVIL